MRRAGVFVGVDRTGGLQPLQDAAAGARRMYDWGVSQGMEPGTTAHLVTDADGATVGPDDVAGPIARLLEGPGVEQLVLYFAGHGVNLQRSERWLLSEAPARTWAAVNVRGSVELARYCGIGHVVVISDACRVAPEGIAAQRVEGVEVFPNVGGPIPSRPVDEFYACLLGMTAAEVRDPADAARGWSALYTAALLDALQGRRPDLLEPGPDGDPARYVRARPLRAYLEAELPARVRAMGLTMQVNQLPDAILTSDREWLARLEELPVGDGAPTPTPPVRGGDGAPGGAAGPVDGEQPLGGPDPRVARRVVDRLVRRGVDGHLDEVLVGAATLAERPAGTELGTFGRTALAVADVVPVRDVTTGVVVRGAPLAEVLASAADAVRVDERTVALENVAHDGASVLVVTASGASALVPALTGTVAHLTFDGPELVDVTWLATSPAGDVADPGARALHVAAAAASRLGRLHLDPDDVARVDATARAAAAHDPALAVLVAYALAAVSPDSAAALSDAVAGAHGVRLLDLEMLARRPVASGDVVPVLPLHTEGWALLRGRQVRLPAGLEELPENLTDGTWSSWRPGGTALLRRAVERGDVR